MSTQEKEQKKNQTSSMKSDMEIMLSKVPLSRHRKNERAVVVLSGGQDSTTALFWAINNFYRVKAIHIQYGQSHAEEELKAVREITQIADVTLDTFPLFALRQIGGGSLTNPQIDVMSPHPVFPWLPGSFIPGRNAVLFSLSAAFAFSKGIPNLVSGVCQTDYSGYPDCRMKFLNSMEIALEDSIGMEEKRTQVALEQSNFRIWAPLMFLTKKETVLLASTFKGCLEALAYSHTCYRGQFPPCGTCPSCVLRKKGFEEAGIADPLFSRKENKNG